MIGLVLSWIAGLLGFVCYVVVFVMAARTGKLETKDWLLGTVGTLCCGAGWFYFLTRANKVTLDYSFDLVSQGRDPAEARKLNKNFKLAAIGTVVFGVLFYVIGRFATAGIAE